MECTLVIAIKIIIYAFEWVAWRFEMYVIDGYVWNDICKIVNCSIL